MTDARLNDQSPLNELEQLACSLGASSARCISPGDICIEDDLVRMCREPRCENYGLSSKCPPHVGGPDEFRELVKSIKHALVFKIDVPSDILLSSDRQNVFRTLHEMAACIEQSAVTLGSSRARAFAGGSCKQLFCQNYTFCRVLKDYGTCRNPHLSRPSMSGFGINVQKLMRTAGWPMNWVTGKENAQKESISPVCGLVLLG